MERPFQAYSGTDPYIFVSYAHKDSSFVYPEITYLKDQGFNIWYDEGIEPGSVWREEIAHALTECQVFLFFITPESTRSSHCLKEVNFALGRDRQVLCVHVQATHLPDALDLSLSDRQAIIRSDYGLGDYREKLSTSLRNLLGQQESSSLEAELVQSIQFCQTPDQINIAYSRIGEGLPIVRSLGWFTNLEMEWQYITSRRFWQQMASEHEIVRYDGRGIGVSDREVEELSLETRLSDLETVINATGHKQVALLGMSEGGMTAMAFAAKYPDKVSHLILWGAALIGTREEDTEKWMALTKLIPSGWGSESDSFRQLFTGLFLPDGTADQNQFFNDMQKASATPDLALKMLASVGRTDVRELAKRIKTPTLVMHRKGDLVTDQRRALEIARTIPGARLMLLEGANHWMWMQEADTAHIIRTISDFVGET
jgi:pimeloyl-ACP methyl ester carboxylesterase